MKTSAYNIVINLPKETGRCAIAMSKRLKGMGGVFALGEKTFVPHITSYLLDIPLKNKKKVIVRLRRLAKETRPISCTALRYWRPPSGYVGIAYHKSKAISDLQKAIVAIINPLRENVITFRDKARLSDVSAAERKTIERFGDSHIGANYHPHVTLSKFAQGEAPTNETISKAVFSFKATTIGLYYRGDHGTCKKLIAQFPLLGK
jgi:2'-5' RNA ligase